MKENAEKYNWELDDKSQNIYENLCSQIEGVFRHCNQGSYKTRESYEDGVKNFAKFLADEYKKQNLNNIKPKHLYGYVEFMQDLDYSTSYVTTNLSAIRFFYDQVGGDSTKLPNNNKLGVIARGKEERIGDNKAWNPIEIENFVKYANDVGQEKYGQMVQLSSQLGLRIMNRNKKIHNTFNAKAVYLLSGLIKCGSKMNGNVTYNRKTGEKISYYMYRCSGNNKSDKKHTKSINKESIEEYIISEMEKVIFSKEAINYLVKELSKFTDVKQKQLEEEIRFSKKKLLKVEKNIENILLAVAEGNRHSSLMDRLSKLESEKEDLVISIEKTKLRYPESEPITEEYLRKIFKEHKSILEKEKSNEQVYNLT